MSLPLPPSRLSRPSRAIRTSLPPLPMRVSALFVPLKVSELSVPILVTAQATPLATNTVRAMVATNNIVRLIIYPFSFCVCDLRQRGGRIRYEAKYTRRSRPLPPRSVGGIAGSRLHHWLPTPYRCPPSPGRASEPLPAVGRHGSRIVRSGTSLKRRIFVVARSC